MRTHPDISHEPPLPPDQRPEKDPLQTAIRVQHDIMARMADDAERLAWADRNAATFRSLFEKDNEFRSAVIEERIDDVIAMMDKIDRERPKQ